MPAAIGTHGTSASADASPSRRVALAEGPADRGFAFDAHRRIALDRFLADVRGVAAGLPEAACAINLDRKSVV